MYILLFKDKHISKSLWQMHGFSSLVRVEGCVQWLRLGVKGNTKRGTCRLLWSCARDWRLGKLGTQWLRSRSQCVHQRKLVRERVGTGAQHLTAFTVPACGRLGRRNAFFKFPKLLSLPPAGMSYCNSMLLLVKIKHAHQYKWEH